MITIGTVESLWRYPVKSMSGEEMLKAFMGFSGFSGDRCYAFKNSAARQGFPYLNANRQQQMLRYHPQFRSPERAITPPNFIEAMSIMPGGTPANGDAEDMILEVVTPSAAVVATNDPTLITMLGEGVRGENHRRLVHSDRALTDCRPVSLMSVQTVQQVEAELDIPLDKRRFRANIYLHLASNDRFAEEKLLGRQVHIGSHAEMAILERDPRCKMISLDPDTSKHNPEVLRKVANAHATFAGVSCAVLVEGVVTKGDSIHLLD